VNIWVEGARPKTLVASIVPVLVGTATAHHTQVAAFCATGARCARHVAGQPIWWRFAAALLVSLAIQIGVNYANDYFDGRKGVDTAARIGPRRLTASGAATHAQMKAAMALAFGVAGVAGLALAAATSWWVLAAGAAAFAAALGYSGGPKPYASLGLGEVFVFVFFGLVATVGSAYVQVERVTRLAVVAAVPVGLLATAILVVNNIRDITTDRASGKVTLAVRLGRTRTRVLYNLLVLGAFVAVVFVALVARSAWPLLPLLAMSVAVKPSMLVVTREDGPGLIQALVATARLQWIFGATLAAGLWIR
jgi:1,4-dihydroxy-2-naphthoate octaprenyltransferase